MGIPSPVRPVAPARCAELERFSDIDAKAVASPQRHQARGLKPWWEAQHLAFPLCLFAGGPPAARHLAAVSRGLRKAVSGAWADLARHFPDRLYVVGGLDRDYRPVSTADRYDPRTGVWEPLPALPSPRSGPSAVAAAGRLYVLGGECRGRALCDVLRFDPWLGSWEVLPPMHEGRIRPAVTICGSYLYVLGGLDGSRPLRSAERYDMLNRIWEVLPAMHRVRYAGSAAIRGHRVFAMGGDIADAGVPAASAEVFDTQLGRWELLPAVQAACCGAATVLTTASGVAFSFGGLGLSGQALGLAKRLAIGTSSSSASRVQSSDRQGLLQWSCIPAMPTPRHQASAAPFRGGAVVVGGKGAKFEAVRDVECFNPDVGTWEVLPELPNPRLRTAVAGGCL
uniref:Uncharacterized protein n=1 Tax=Pyrodinium bahamense TaxID=73915 RepID=A0A7S0AJY8_9DINO|mmetsp:Transcript_3626/g.9917  ORF Transcript_3626/g.9917 Transcript_3626/m.9917 type:complete len:396 (+) Transcript_3626:73-1260(+)